jgi:GTP cyclohydrolase IB
MQEVQELVDVQSRRDDRGVAIKQAGVSDLRYPIVVLDKDQGEQKTVARLTMSVSLPDEDKGTHMSRFIEVLNQFRDEVTMRTLPAILHSLRERLGAKSARIEVHFTYFLERAAPVTSARALMDYECKFIGETNCETDDFVLGVTVPVTTLCPCSKEMSIEEGGAHNQRGYVTIDVRSARTEGGQPELVWIEELIAVAEASASAPVYPLLKRPDEKYVTDLAYRNPVFVEDLVRNVAKRLQSDHRIAWFTTRAVNHESIHNHNAFAVVEWARAGSISY